MLEVALVSPALSGRSKLIAPGQVGGAVLSANGVVRSKISVNVALGRRAGTGRGRGLCGRSRLCNGGVGSGGRMRGAGSVRSASGVRGAGRADDRRGAGSANSRRGVSSENVGGGVRCRRLRGGELGG